MSSFASKAEPARLSRRRPVILLMCSIAFVVLCGLSAGPAAAVCLPTGRACGNQGLPSNDRLCCPGSICGWGNVCRSGCRINGVLYAPGAKNPANPCQVCRPTSSTSAWSAQANGTACDDRNACTRGDTCRNGSCSPGEALLCDDGNPCTIDRCNPASGCISEPGCTVAEDCGNSLCLAFSCDGGCCSAIDRCPPTIGSCRNVSGECVEATGQCVEVDEPDGTPCDTTTGSTQCDGNGHQDGSHCDGACSSGTCEATGARCSAVATAWCLAKGWMVAPWSSSYPNSPGGSIFCVTPGNSAGRDCDACGTYNQLVWKTTATDACSSSIPLSPGQVYGGHSPCSCGATHFDCGVWDMQGCLPD